MAEIELSVLKRQWSDQRIPTQDLPASEAKAWEDERNDQVDKVLWWFTTADVRIKLKYLYPQVRI